MQFFPRDGHCSASLQIIDSARNFVVPCLLDGFIRNLKAVQKAIGQCGSFVRRKGKRPF